MNQPECFVKCLMGLMAQISTSFLAAFLFLYFLKMFFTEIYFRFHILQFYTPTAQQGGGRDLHVNKYNFFYAEAPGGSLPPGGGAAGSPPAPVEGRQAPPKYKS